MPAQISMLIDEIKKRKARRVMLQLPEGLKVKAVEIIDAIENAGVECILSAKPSYGACDTADEEAAAAGCDILVHVGHSKFYRDFKTDVPVMYFPWKMDVTVKDVDFSIIKEKRVGVATTIQHMSVLDDIAAMLKKAGKDVAIGGQILGCWTINAEKLDTEAILFIGSGSFHPLGISGKRVYSLNLEKMAVETVDTALSEKKRYANIYNARDAKTFAILVSTKKGQFALAEARRIKERLREKGKKAFVAIMDDIKSDRLLGLKADAFINTACPRLADDAFAKPFVNACDIELVFE